MSIGHEKHEFALYVANLADCLAAVGTSGQLVITDTVLLHRVQHVLRLVPGDSITLFDRTLQAHCLLHAVTKKNITCLLRETKKHTILSPSITFFLPLLKKDDLEAALYSLVELGATTIQLITTEKSRQLGNKEREAHELERLERVMIAAAEQSKQFSIPQLKEPVSLQAAISSINPSGSYSIFFDPEGSDLFSVVSDMRTVAPTMIYLLVGPEGDLTAQEKSMVTQRGLNLCTLTPTVLRAMQAVAVGMGVVRSVLTQ